MHLNELASVVQEAFPTSHVCPAVVVDGEVVIVWEFSDEVPFLNVDVITQSGETRVSAEDENAVLKLREAIARRLTEKTVSPSF